MTLAQQWRRPLDSIQVELDRMRELIHQRPQDAQTLLRSVVVAPHAGEDADALLCFLPGFAGLGGAFVGSDEEDKCDDGEE